VTGLVEVDVYVMVVKENKLFVWQHMREFGQSEVYKGDEGINYP